MLQIHDHSVANESHISYGAYGDEVIVNVMLQLCGTASHKTTDYLVATQFNISTAQVCLKYIYNDMFSTIMVLKY